MHDPSIPPLELNIYNRDDSQKYLLGLDFGKQRSHSAYVVLERANRVGSQFDKHTRMRPWRPVLRIRRIERFPLGTEYTKVLHEIWKILRPPLLRDRTYIAYDATGVGIALRETLRQANLPATLLPCTIAAQSERKPDFFTEVIGKAELVQFLRFMLQSKYLVVNPELPLAPALLEELQNFEQLRSSAGNRLFRGRSSGHDDLVMALSLAVWKSYCLYENDWRTKVTTPYIAHNDVWNGRHDQFQSYP